MRRIQSLSNWITALFFSGTANRKLREESVDAATVVFTLPDGRKLTHGDLTGLTGKVNFREGRLLEVTGTVRYEIIGKEMVPAEAERLYRQGREAGGTGDLQRAIRVFGQASALAPNWPYPVYDTAFTYLLMKDFDQARRYYQRTLELSPRGFFTATTALDTPTREQNGDLPAGT